MSDLRRRLIRLAHANPQIRPHLLPLLGLPRQAKMQNEEALRLVQISLENASNIVDDVVYGKSPEAKRVGAKVKVEIGRVLKLVQEELQPAIQPGLIEQVSRWFH